MDDIPIKELQDMLRFDTYTRKSLLYYLLQTISILSLVFLIIAKITKLQIPPSYKVFLTTIIVLSIVTIIVNLILTGTSLVTLYKKKGDLIITTESITLNNKIVLISNIQEIKIAAKDYKGKRSSDGSGNRIALTYNNNIINSRFVIASKDQLEKLNKTINEWKSRGVVIDQNYFL